jgi:hypothetical protein
MNKLIGGIALLVLVGAGSSAHADGPWCAFYDASTYNCGSTASSSAMRPYAGRAGRAGPIFSRTSVTAGRQDGARRADVTDHCRTSSPQKERQPSIELVMESEMRRRALPR